MLTTWHPSRSLALAATAAVMLLASPAAANKNFKNPTNPVAKAHLNKGNRLYKLQDFKQAIKEYKAGALVEDLPIFLYNLGQSYRQMGDYANAIWYYKRYLRQGNPQPALKKWVTDVIEDMEKELQRAARTKPPTGPGPGDAVPPTNKSRPNLQPVMGSEEQPSPWHADALGWTLTGAGVVGIGIGIGLFINASDLENADPPDQQERQRNLDTAESRRLYGTISTIAGAALVVGGIIRLISTPPAKRAAQSAQRDVSLVVGRQYVGLAGRF